VRKNPTEAHTKRGRENTAWESGAGSKQRAPTLAQGNTKVLQQGKNGDKNPFGQPPAADGIWGRKEGSATPSQSERKKRPP